MKLYSYWRSSAAYRVRIVLNLKGIEAEQQAINLLDGEQKSESYMALNPVGLVPSLELDDGRVIGQSLAILQWLEEEYPEPALLPGDSFERSRVMSWIQTIACDIHPILNLAILNFLQDDFEIPAREVYGRWYPHWLQRGFNALEEQLSAAPYCYGEQLTLADAYLVPQVYNARRMQYDMEQHPKLCSIVEACNQLPAFIDAMPENQPDAP